MRKCPFQDAVDDKIRIAANRRSEVRVFVKAQRKVTERIGGVARLLERTQHEIRKNALFGLADDFANEALIMLRCDTQLPSGERDAHRALAAVSVRIGPARLRGRRDAPMAHGDFALMQILDPKRITESVRQLFKL